MASAAPSGDGGGDDKPPETSPASFTSLDPPADPQRNGESPAPPSAPVTLTVDVDMSATGMTEIPEPAKRVLPSRPAPCPACARRKMILRGIDPVPPRDDELSALPSAPGMGTELQDPGALGTNASPSATGWCGPCEFRKKIMKIHLNRRLRRNSEVTAPPSGSFTAIPRLDDQSPLPLEQKRLARMRRGKKRPLSVEQERGYRECDVGKKLMRHRWDGLRHKWAGLQLHRDFALEMPGFFGDAAGGRDLLEMMPGFRAGSGGRDLLEMPGFRAWSGGRNLPEIPGFGAAAGGRNLLEMPGFCAMAGGRDLLEMPGFCAMAGGRDLLEKMMLEMQKAMRVDYAKLAPSKGAQKPSSSAAARVDILHEKLAQMTKVLTKVLRERSILQVSTKLMRLLCPDVGSGAAAGGGLDGSDCVLVQEAIGNLVNQTGEGMQDIVKSVIPKVFSKEILYDLIMACVGRYPKLLDDNKGKLTKEKHEQYQKQLDLMVNLTTVYENNPENFSKILELMFKIGRCGPVPSEVIDDISPGLDPSSMEQLYTEMLELLHNLDRASPGHTNPSSK